MEEKNTGGPAFPTENEAQTGNSTYRYEGMTLRDYAAVHAEVEEMSMHAAEVVTGRKCPEYKEDPIGNMIFWADAEYAIRYLKADAMLKARKS